jgi:primosomal protein N'
MAALNCPVCENKIEFPDRTKAGERITCPRCYAQLALYKHKGEWVVGCAFCKEPVFDPALCEECERRHERKKLLEEGRL